MLCDTCISLIRKLDKTPHKAQQKVGTLENLTESVNQGCSTCTRRRFAISDEEWDELLSRPEGLKTQMKYLVARIKRVSTDTSMSFVLTTTIRGKQHRIYFHETNPNSDSSVASLASLSTADPAILDLAKSWLNDCKATHSHCQHGPGAISTLPDRLIDLQPPGLPQSSWRLIQTSTTVIQEPYATLSHRWGPLTFRINDHTEASMMNGLPLDSLPPVFKDAVRIAKHLGARYLWIDNPCIPQTSFDISVQAAKMAEVFGSADFNISALAGRQDRLFSLEPTKAWSDTGFLDRSQYQLSRSYNLDFDYIWKTEVRSAPLLRRGWIYQEQLLARRTIYFGASQIFWECRTGRRCEKQPLLKEFEAKFDRIRSIKITADLGKSSIHDKPDDLFDSAHHSLQLISAASKNQVAESLLKANYSDANELSKLWLRLVTIYSTRELTDSNDKLLAIAGVARTFESVAKDGYLAGHWRKQLPAHLLWRRQRGRRLNIDKNMENCQRSSSAPSWSWASIDDEVDFFAGDYHPIHTVAQVMQADVDPLYGNLYGQVRSGRLRLRCPIVPISPDGKDSVTLDAFGAVSLPSSRTVLKAPRSAFDLALDFEEIVKRKRGPISAITEVFNKRESKLVLAIIQTRDEILPGGTQKRKIYGLLLLRTKASTKGPIDAYKRVGAVKIDRPRDLESGIDEKGIRLSCIPDRWRDLFRHPWDAAGEYVQKETFLDFESADYLTTLDIV